MITHKYVPVMPKGTEVPGHDCTTKAELQDYAKALGLTIKVVPLSEYEKNNGFIGVPVLEAADIPAAGPAIPLLTPTPSTTGVAADPVLAQAMAPVGILGEGAKTYIVTVEGGMTLTVKASHRDYVRQHLASVPDGAYLRYTRAGGTLTSYLRKKAPGKFNWYRKHSWLASQMKHKGKVVLHG